MLISKTFVPKQTRETNIAGRGGKRDTCTHERTKFISWFSAALQQIMNGIVGRDAVLSVWQITEFWLNL